MRISWKKTYSARIHSPQANYADVEGMQEYGYASIPPIEETLANYLLISEVSTLKTPSLPTQPLHLMSHLNGRAYAAAGQAGAALRTIAVLQA